MILCKNTWFVKSNAIKRYSYFFLQFSFNLSARLGLVSCILCKKGSSARKHYFVFVWRGECKILPDHQPKFTFLEKHLLMKKSYIPMIREGWFRWGGGEDIRDQTRKVFIKEMWGFEEYYMRIPKNCKKYNHSWKKLWYVVQVVLKKYFNWKQSPFQFYKKTKNQFFIKNTKNVCKLVFLIRINYKNICVNTNCKSEMWGGGWEKI